MNKLTLNYIDLKSAPKEIQSVFSSLQSEIDFSLLPPFSGNSADLAFVINTLVEMPLILQASTGTRFDLSQETIETFLTLAKAKIETSGDAKKIAQLKATVAFIKQGYEAAQGVQAPPYPLTAKALALIAQILK